MKIPGRAKKILCSIWVITLTATTFWVPVVHADDSGILSDSAITVQVDPDFPQVLTYTLNSTGGALLGGDIGAAHQVFITDIAHDQNDAYTSTDGTSGNVEVAYPASVTSFTQSTSEADYTVSVPDFDGGIAFDYTIALNGNEVVRKLKDISGPGEPQLQTVRIDVPILRTTIDQDAPGYAFSKQVNPDLDTGRNSPSKYGSLFSTDLQDLRGDSIGSLTAGTGAFSAYANWAFVNIASAVGTAYNNLYDVPFLAKVETYAGVQSADIYDRPYNYRFSNVGSTPEKTFNIRSDRDFTSTTYICGDVNGNRTIDWQDAAIWVRSQLPQMPESLQNFYHAGGEWCQTHGSFPNGGSSSANVRTPYGAFQSQAEQVYYQTDGSPQSYEIAGWQNVGHDWGWDDWTQSVNPGMGGLSAMDAARKALLNFGDDLSFHLNYVMEKAPYHNTDILSLYPDGTMEGSANNPWGQTYQDICVWLDWASGNLGNKINTFENSYWSTSSPSLGNPLLLYTDQTWDQPSFADNVNGVMESYGKAKAIATFANHGTYIMNEGYQPTQRRNGMFGFKYRNDTDNGGSVIDSFINAGVTKCGILNGAYSSNWYLMMGLGTYTADSNNIILSSDVFANSSVSTNYEVSYLEDWLSTNQAMQYVNNANEYAVQWGSNIIASVNKSTGNLLITQGQVTVADNTARFIPSIDGSQKIYVFDTTAETHSWVLPSSWNCTSVDRYELTSSGKSYIDRVPVINGTITLRTPANTPYFIVPAASSAVSAGPVDQSLTSTATASSGTAANAVDGSTDTSWTPATSGNEWLETDFAKQTQVDRVDVNEVGNKVQSFDVQYYDGSAWQTVYTGTAIGADGIFTFPAVNIQRVRIEILTASSIPSISEFGVYGDADLARTGSAVASSNNDYGDFVDSQSLIADGITTNYRYDCQAMRALDGSCGVTYWKASSASNQWLQVNLSRAQNINKIILSEENNFANALGNITGYNLQYSDDGGSTWNSFTGVNDAGNGVYIGTNDQIIFDAVNATDVRLNITGANAAPAITTFSVYDIGGAAPAIAPAPPADEQPSGGGWVTLDDNSLWSDHALNASFTANAGGGWKNYSSGRSQDYNGSFTASNQGTSYNGTFTFTFSGTQFEWVAETNSTYYDTNASVSIDGASSGPNYTAGIDLRDLYSTGMDDQTYPAPATAVTGPATTNTGGQVAYVSPVLPAGIHTVTIKGAYIDVDAIRYYSSWITVDDNALWSDHTLNASFTANAGGGWKNYSSGRSQDYDGSFTASNQGSPYSGILTFTFSGTQFEWIAETNSAYYDTNASVSIDGASSGSNYTVGIDLRDLYSAGMADLTYPAPATTVTGPATTNTGEQVVYVSPVLSPGYHTVTIKGAYIDVDAIRYNYVYVPMIQPLLEFDSTTAAYTGSTISANGAAVVDPTGGGTPTGTITYTYYDDVGLTSETSTTDGSGATAVGGAPANIGTYYVVARYPGDSNYFSATYTSELIISP